MSPEHARRRRQIKGIVLSGLGVFAASLLALGVYLYFHNLQENELKESLIANCERNGNPLREVLQHRIQREIKQNENQALLEKLLPNTDPKELKEFAERSIKILHKEEEEIAPVDCQDAYSK